MKTSNKLLKLVTFSCISLLVFGILACTNIVDHKEENSYIRISATTPNMRTILPTAFTADTEGLNWFLTGIKDDTTVTFNKSWTDTTGKTAYENMTSETFIIPEKGNWTLSLIAQIDGKNVLSCTLTNVQINIGENNLIFVMTEATGDNIANGQIDFTLKFPKDIVSKAVAYLYNKNDVDNIIHTEYLTVNTSDMSLNYKNESLSSGYYILKINLYQNVNNTDSLINTYTCLVRVAPGLCSKGEYQLEKLAQIFTINYNTNGGNFSDPFIPTTYNTYTKFQLPTPTKVGYIFTGWYTDENCTTKVILDDSNAYNLTANVDLYAGWEAKGSQYNPITNWEDLVAVMTEDGGDIYISGNMTANKTLTVTKVSKLIAKEAVSITRGENFTSNFFNVSSGVSLEIAGSENSTITIDGGNSDSNPISVQSPLITVNGELTLSNCTLQNNNNSNYVGAVYVGAGTFTMNDGVTITNCKATDGGAVYITGGGIFKMTGGTITGCSATNSGGGVWMNTVSSFTMSGNSKIENCTATNNEGGGVYVTDVNNPCTFIMLDNATITGCSAEKGGGGVSYGCSTSGTFEISENAKISNNINNNNSYGGGGIYLYGKLTMKGGIISGNEASNGAGVYVRHDSSSFTMNGGTISDNKATVSGGGVYLSYSNSSFTMTAGTISNNLVNGINHGASIQINDGTVHLPNFDTSIGDSFTYNIIDGEVQYPSGGTTATYDIGDVYPKDGTPIGVVFKVTDDYVYIIGFEEQQLIYGTTNCVTQIKSNEPTTNNFNNLSDGCQNMTNWYSFITTNSNVFSSAEFPAFNYCLTYRDTEGEGGTWYLPSKEELSTIKNNITNINTTLETEGTGINTNTTYWSSTYSSDGNAYIISTYSGSTSEYTLDTPCYVRPCKRIKIADDSSDVLIYGLDVDTACNAISNIYTEGEHYIKLDSSVTADNLEKDIYEKLYNLLDEYPTAFVYLDLYSTQITELPAETFWRLKNLSGVILPSTIQTIDASAFQGCINLTKFVVPADNQYFTVDESIPAILLSKDKSKLISYPYATGEYTIPENITSLAEYAFGDATNLTSVTIHANLTDIPSNAFYGAWDLKTFTVNSGNSEYTADDSGEILLSKDKTELISWPYAYEDITIPDSVTKIADYALAETGITSVVLNNVEEIGEYAFYSCLGYRTTDFTSLTIPSSVTKIGKYAFYGCEYLEEVEFADTNNKWTVKNNEGQTESVTVTNFDVNNLIYASDDDTFGYADYTWIKDSSSTSGGGIANYTDTNGISISNNLYQKTSLVTVISENVTVDCNYEENGVFYFYGNVTISPFAMGQYEVTQELYQAVMGENPSSFTDENITSGENQNLRPVDSVNWYQAVAFCNELTKKNYGI